MGATRPDARPGGPALPDALRVPVAALAAALLALVLRLPARSLPIEGDAVAYGALGQALARGEGFALDGAPHDRYPPGYPALLAVPIAAGARVTSAVRTTAWALGGVAAGLLVLVGARLSRGRASLPVLAALAAAHPDLGLFVGGLVPGSEALTLVLLLGAVALATRDGPAARLVAVACAGLLPLVRYDAAPFALAAAVLAARGLRGRVRVAALALALGPGLGWLVRNVVVLGALVGEGYAHHGLDAGRLGRNLLVCLGLQLPVASLVLLLPYAGKGGRALWGAAGHRAVARAFLAASAAHLLLVLATAGPTGAGPSALQFSSGSLRFALAAWPALFVAAARGVGDEKRPLRTAVTVATWVLTVPVALHAVSGGLQRALPAGPLAAARLHTLAEAYDAAVAEAGPADWIAVDLLPRRNEGVEVFLGDRAPGRVTGAFVAPGPDPARGRFPRVPLLPLDRAFPSPGQVLLVTDVPREGPVYTGDRPDLRVGGRGIFHRALVREVDGGRAGTVRVDSVKRPSTR